MTATSDFCSIYNEVDDLIKKSIQPKQQTILNMKKLGGVVAILFLGLLTFVGAALRWKNINPLDATQLYVMFIF